MATLKNHIFERNSSDNAKLLNCGCLDLAFLMISKKNLKFPF